MLKWQQLTWQLSVENESSMYENRLMLYENHVDDFKTTAWTYTSRLLSCYTVNAWFQFFGDISSQSLFSPARESEQPVYLLGVERVGYETSEIDFKEVFLCVFISACAQVSYANIGCIQFLK